jgi:hypothetical protein
MRTKQGLIAGNETSGEYDTDEKEEKDIVCKE